MSTVLWANCLIDGVVHSDQEDRAALYKHAGKLDAIAKSLCLPSFQGACDQTDLRYNLEDIDLPDGMDSTNEVMAVSGLWLSRADALSMLQGLLAHIRKDKTRFGLWSNQHQAVVDELAGAIGFLEAQARADKFNFAVVM